MREGRLSAPLLATVWLPRALFGHPTHPGPAFSNLVPLAVREDHLGEAASQRRSGRRGRAGCAVKCAPAADARGRLPYRSRRLCPRWNEGEVVGAAGLRQPAAPTMPGSRSRTLPSWAPIWKTPPRPRTFPLRRTTGAVLNPGAYRRRGDSSASALGRCPCNPRVSALFPSVQLQRPSLELRRV